LLEVLGNLVAHWISMVVSSGYGHHHFASLCDGSLRSCIGCLMTLFSYPGGERWKRSLAWSEAQRQGIQWILE